MAKRTPVPSTPVAAPTPTTLVDAVPGDDRLQLLGELLCALRPFAREATNDETAEETLHRLTDEVKRLRGQVSALGTLVQEAGAREEKARAEAERLLTAMSCRRSPETSLVARVESLRAALESAGIPVEPGAEVEVVSAVLSERAALREVFANTAKPSRLVVLRDDSSGGVKERYTLLAGEVKEGRLSLKPLEAGPNSSWIDLRPAMETRVVPFLTPVAFGGRR